MPNRSNPDASAEADQLRAIEELVQASPGQAAPPAAVAEDADLETVARDLGISVEEARSLRDTALD